MNERKDAISLIVAAMAGIGLILIYAALSQ